MFPRTPNASCPVTLAQALVQILVVNPQDGITTAYRVTVALKALVALRPQEDMKRDTEDMKSLVLRSLVCDKDLIHDTATREDIMAYFGRLGEKDREWSLLLGLTKGTRLSGGHMNTRIRLP